MKRILKKGMKLKDNLTYAYIRKIKKWMFCPNCQEARLLIDKNSNVWICEKCGYMLSADEFEDDYVFWFCDNCEAYLNSQDGFNRTNDTHVCQKCGFVNNTTEENIVNTCKDCGVILNDPKASLCEACKFERKQKSVERLEKTKAVLDLLADFTQSVGAALDKNDEVKNRKRYTAHVDYDGRPMRYPICNVCGTTMTDYDGWAWYTCPECGNKIEFSDET